MTKEQLKYSRTQWAELALQLQDDREKLERMFEDERKRNDALAEQVRELEAAAVRGEAENLRLRGWLEWIIAKRPDASIDASYALRGFAVDQADALLAALEDTRGGRGVSDE